MGRASFFRELDSECRAYFANLLRPMFIQPGQVLALRPQSHPWAGPTFFVPIVCRLLSAGVGGYGSELGVWRRYREQSLNRADCAMPGTVSSCRKISSARNARASLL